MQKKQSKIMKRKTRQGKALEKKAARSFMDVLQEVSNLVLLSLFLAIFILLVVYLKDFYSGSVTGLPCLFC